MRAWTHRGTHSVKLLSRSFKIALRYLAWDMTGLVASGVSPDADRIRMLIAIEPVTK